MIHHLNHLSRSAKVALWALFLPLLAAAGAFAYWTLSPLFYDVAVNERLPQAGGATAETGLFLGADSFHFAEGTVTLVDAAAEKVIRFKEDFKVRNGPDLYVWLVRDGKVEDGYIDLGRLKGNLGAQNYTIPAHVDLEGYNTVIIWCKAFSVLFGSATLNEGGT